MIDLTYGGRSGAQEGVALVRDIRRALLPGVRLHTLPLGGHGIHYFGRRYDERTIEVDVVLAADTISLLRDHIRNVAAWLNSEVPRQLVFSDEPDKFYMALIDGQTMVEQAISDGNVTLRFLCPDPFAYALSPDLVVMTATPLVHYQRGSAPADPLLRLQGASTGAGGQQISVTVGGQSVTYRGVLAAGDWLEIDCSEKTATRVVGTTRANAVGSLVKPIFPQLASGSNNISVTPEGGATWTRLEIHCRNRWL